MKASVLVVFSIGVSLFLPFTAYSDCAKRSMDKAGWCHPQCVEYVKCKLGINHGGNAASWWTNPPHGYKQRPNGSSSKPGKNDIVVWTQLAGGLGHVAIIESVDTKRGQVIVVDTNYSNDYKKDCKERKRPLKLTVKKNKYSIEGCAGWLERK